MTRFVRPFGLLTLLLLPVIAQMTYQDLVRADPNNWLTYSGPYNGQRHSLLKQINKGEVKTLVTKWIYHVPRADHLESVPIVVDGVMYLTQPNEVYALDGRTGRLIWRYRHQPPLGKGPNRGAAGFGDSGFLTPPGASVGALGAPAG